MPERLSRQKLRWRWQSRPAIVLYAEHRLIPRVCHRKDEAKPVVATFGVHNGVAPSEVRPIQRGRTSKVTGHGHDNEEGVVAMPRLGPGAEKFVFKRPPVRVFIRKPVNTGGIG